MNLPRYAKLAGLGGRLYPALDAGLVQWRTSPPESHLSLKETTTYLEMLTTRGEVELEVFERQGSIWRTVETSMVEVQQVEPDGSGYEVIVNMTPRQTAAPRAAGSKGGQAERFTTAPELSLAK